jgi:hypothetical protein
MPLHSISAGCQANAKTDAPSNGSHTQRHSSTHKRIDFSSWDHLHHQSTDDLVDTITISSETMCSNTMELVGKLSVVSNGMDPFQEKREKGVISDLPIG